MPVRSSNWYASNGTRSYPLDDAASGIDDAGLGLPPDILVDAYVVYPGPAAGRAFVAAVSATLGQVSVILALPSGAPLGVVTVPRPVPQWTQIPVAPFAPGVGGWVVFGPGAAARYTGRFSTPDQGALSPHACRAYPVVGLPGLVKVGATTALDGVVELVGAGDVAITAETVGVKLEFGQPVVPTRAVVFRLVPTPDGNVFADYSGECAQRPENGDCGKTPLQTVNGVPPDCDGDIRLKFTGVTAYPFDIGGTTLSLPLGVEAACIDPSAPDPQQIASDLCAHGVSSSSACTPPEGESDCGCLIVDGVDVPLVLHDAYGMSAMESTAPGLWTLVRSIPYTALWACGPHQPHTAQPMTYTLTCVAGTVYMKRTLAACGVVFVDEIQLPAPGPGPLAMNFHFTAGVPPLWAQTVTVTGPPCGSGGVPGITPSALSGGVATLDVLSDDMSNLPMSAASSGAWGSPSGAAVGSWSLGVALVPPSSFGPGSGGPRVVKAATGSPGPAVDPFDPMLSPLTLPFFPEIGHIATTLVKPAANGGVATGYGGTIYYLSLVNAAAGTLDVWSVTGSVVALLDSMPLSFALPAGSWYRVAASYRPGGALDVVSTVYDPATEAVLAEITTMIPAIDVGSNFGVATLSSAALFAHFLLTL